MKLEFLWDEQKTRGLVKTQLWVYTIGVTALLAYVIAMLRHNPHFIILTALPVIFYPIFLLNALMLNRPNSGRRFLIVLLLAQTACAIYMLLIGSLSIIQFAPFVLLFVSMFQLGPIPTLIYGIYALISFTIVIIADQLTLHHLPILDFLFYMLIFALFVIGQYNAGQEISLQFEAKKRLEQIDDLKNQFMSLSSHYLRTPLTIMKGYIAELENIPLQGAQENVITNIKAAIAQLETLVEKFLFISSIERGSIKLTRLPTDIDGLIAGIVDNYRPLAEKKHLTLTYNKQFDVSSKLPVDPISLREAIISLLDNAIKFTPDNGHVTLTLDLNHQEMLISVADNGPGITKDHLATIFSPFNRGELQQTLEFNNPGVGIGLYLAKLIAEAHGGTITLTSQLRHGATFTIHLPLEDPAKTPAIA